MASKKRELMPCAPLTSGPGATRMSAPPAESEPRVKLGVMIDKSLNKRLNLEAATREVTKQDLVNAILASYFAGEDEEGS